MRGYGLTRGRITQEEYCPADSADDVYRFLLDDIAAGRLEVFNLWVQAFDHDGRGRGPPGGDHATLEDLTIGIQQLCFNNQRNSLTDALSKNSLITASRNRAGTPQAVKDTYHATVGWFLKRRPLPREALARIQCSVRLIHCEDDVAYPVQYTEDLEDRLRDAGIADVELLEVPGPHYGSVVNPQAYVSFIVSLSPPPSVTKTVF
ncbi:hypothetical protein C0989_006934 [Termitomyces sp. Mn162]|nr:hypothetical protein C0989_006934 [Termitomyces sp. Mn162]